VQHSVSVIAIALQEIAPRHRSLGLIDIELADNRDSASAAVNASGRR